MNKNSIRRLLALCLLLYVNSSLAKTKANDSFLIKNSEIITIKSKVLGRKYDLNIKLPRHYFKSENKSKKYPVLYLNDAPHTFKVAAGVTHFPSMDKAIVVGISFAHGENGQYSRVRDLTPEIDESWTNYKTGGAPKYLEFIEHEVFAFIETNYRIDINQRILSGHSLGGSFGAWVLLTKPELFSSYILTSPSFWYKNDWIFDVEEKYFKNNTSLNAKVYIATGALETLENGMRNDMVTGHVKFLKRLHSRNYQGMSLKDEIVEGTDHSSTFPVGLAKGLMFIYKDL
jgi:predicted alpha/beta superfamily hydrolase